MDSSTNRSSMENEKNILEQKLILLGRDVGSIPCFRNSFLYGLVGGFMVGISTFAFTSKIRKSTTVGFYSYVGITLAYWIHCRWEYSNTKFQYVQLQHALKMQSMYEGTNKDMKKVAATESAEDK